MLKTLKQAGGTQPIAVNPATITSIIQANVNPPTCEITFEKDNKIRVDGSFMSVLHQLN